MNNRSALIRFCLEFVAMLLGYEAPELEYGLRAALADPDDARAADQVAVLARKHRRAWSDHQRLVEPAIVAFRGEWIDDSAWRLLAATALHALRSNPGRFPWAAEVQGTAIGSAIDDAFRASQQQDVVGVSKALGASALRGAPAGLAAILAAIAEIHRGEVTERLPAHSPRRSEPPPGFNLDRGRKSRADIVMAVLRAREVQLREVERGRPRPVTRDDLAEAILRDPFWDDIDASVQEDRVVERILGEGAPSPAIDLSAHGLPQVYIKRIVR